MAEFCEVEKPIPRVEELTETDLAQQKEPTFTRIEIEDQKHIKTQLFINAYLNIKDTKH